MVRPSRMLLDVNLPARWLSIIEVMFPTCAPLKTFIAIPMRVLQSWMPVCSYCVPPTS